MSEQSFGYTASQLTNITELLDLEKSNDRARRFLAIDAFVGNLMVRSLRGQRIVELIHPTEDDYCIVLDADSIQYRPFIDETFGLAAQQARGAWYIPNTIKIRFGWVNLPYKMRYHERFAAGNAWEEREKINLHSSPDAMAIWALLEPLADTLYMVFALRGPLTGMMTPEESTKLWTEITVFLNMLGFNLADELAILRHGKVWSKLCAEEHIAAKRLLLEAMARQVTPEMAVRYRAYRLFELIKEYYKKAKADGRIKRIKVIKTTLKNSLSAFFGGDWIAFIDYLGEEPHPDEEIFTKLPKTRLYLGTSSRIAEIAEQQGLPVEEVEQMLVSYWHQPAGAAPIEQRVTVMRRYWDAFDSIHSHHTVKMSSLWGLLDERFIYSAPFQEREDNPHPFLYRELLPSELVTEVNKLWGTMMLPRYPEYILSEPFPHAVMAETFGPAITFWHRSALTAWFLCVGPRSLTDMVGLEKNLQRRLTAIADYGTPVDRQLFKDLILAQKYIRSKNDYKRLRDIITQYRRTWAKEHLDTYLRARWEVPLRDVSQMYNKLRYDKGKAPTVKQTANLAKHITNQWFAGDLHAFYGAIGEKAPLKPERRLRLPDEREWFIRDIFARLGGQQLGSNQGFVGDFYSQQQKQWGLFQLTSLSLTYIQLWEILDRPPKLEEMGSNAFEYNKIHLSDDTEKAWQIFSMAIAESLEISRTSSS